LLCGAMPAAVVASYEGTKYDKFGNPPFLSIPLEQLTISAKTLYKALLNAKSSIDTLDKIKT